VGKEEKVRGGKSVRVKDGNEEGLKKGKRFGEKG
jgi:hypothetical protein